MLPLLVKAFAICVKDKFDITEINLLTLMTDIDIVEDAYRNFEAYLSAVQACIRYNVDPEDAIENIKDICDVDSFKVSLQYLRTVSTEGQVCLYLD